MDRLGRRVARLALAAATATTTMKAAQDACARANELLTEALASYQQLMLGEREAMSRRNRGRKRAR